MELVDAIMRYGRHSQGCAGQGECSCGLDDVLSDAGCLPPAYYAQKMRDKLARLSNKPSGGLRLPRRDAEAIARILEEIAS